MKNQDQVFMIVDDEPDMCWALENILSQNGLRSIKTSNGREALALMKRYRFSLIFLDAKLPDMEGLLLARRIKKIDPYVPIVLISGYYYKDDADIQNARTEELISGFIAKPFNHSEVLKALESAS